MARLICTIVLSWMVVTNSFAVDLDVDRDGKVDLTFLPTIPASQISITDPGSIIAATNVDSAFDELKAAIDLNTVKITNATHTGDVTGSGTLTIATGAVAGDELASTAVTAGAYSWANFTVDADGRLTAASSNIFNAGALGITDTAEVFTATNTEDALNELYDSIVGLSASDIPVIDDDEHFTGEDVETILAEIATSVETNTSDIAAIVPVRHYGYWPIPIAGDLCSVDGSSPPDAVATHNEYPYRTYSSEADEDTLHRFDVPPDMMATDTRTWFRIKCLVTAETGPSASEGIAFALQGVSGGHGDPTGYTKGDLAVSTIEGAADQWDLYVTDWAAVTIPGIAPGETAELKLLRDVSDAVDDYGQLIGAFLLEMRYVRFETEVAAP